MREHPQVACGNNEDIPSQRALSLWPNSNHHHPPTKPFLHHEAPPLICQLTLIAASLSRPRTGPAAPGNRPCVIKLFSELSRETGAHDHGSQCGACPIHSTDITVVVAVERIPWAHGSVTPQLLNGLADTVAQSVTAVRQHQTRSKVATKRPRRGPSIELRDFGDVPLGGNGGDLYATNSYDVERWIRFMAWGKYDHDHDILPISGHSSSSPRIPISSSLFYSRQPPPQPHH